MHRRLHIEVARIGSSRRTWLRASLRGSLANGAGWRVCVCVMLMLFVCATAARPAAAADEVIDRVLAVVSGDVITLSDVRAALTLGRVQVGDAPDPVRVVLSQLIDRALLLAEVNRFAPPEPSTLTIDAALESVVARFPSPDTFDATLERLGVDRAFVRDLLREDLLIRAYLDQRFTAQTVTEQRALVDAWLEGLRRRADIVDQYGDAPVAPSRR